MRKVENVHLLVADELKKLISLAEEVLEGCATSSDVAEVAEDMRETIIRLGAYVKIEPALRIFLPPVLRMYELVQYYPEDVLRREGEIYDEVRFCVDDLRKIRLYLLPPD